jgi:hypothetical protein
MKWVLIVLGVLLFLVGVVWVLQGSNVLTQGMMAGHRRWIVLGGVLDAAGIALFVWGVTRRRMRAA